MQIKINNNKIGGNMAERKTNVELITDIMENSIHGGMAQAFVIDALVKHTDFMIENKEQILKEEKEDENNGKRSFISMAYWISIAEEISTKIKER